MKGNVLVIGNAGVGKSTLINAVLGKNAEKKAKTGRGIKRITTDIEPYESEELPFCMIDTVGFESSLVRKAQTVGAVKKWSKENIKKGNHGRQINVIWFCIDGTCARLFPETIRNLFQATSMWKSVPIVAVITKSFAIPEREKNIEIVREAFAQQKNGLKNLRKILPVVADTYVLNESAYAPPEGITELIELTNELMPDGIRAAESDIERFQLIDWVKNVIESRLSTEFIEKVTVALQQFTNNKDKNALGKLIMELFAVKN